MSMEALLVSPQQVAINIVEVVQFYASHTEAEVGIVVQVQVTLMNVNESYSPWPVMPILNYTHPVNGTTQIPLRNVAGEDWAMLEYGDSDGFTGSFIMPGADVVLTAGAYFLWGPYGSEYWQLDTALTLSVNLIGGTAGYVGTITKKQLRHNSTQSDIPVTGVPLNEEAILYIYGTNDMATIQKMGVDWVIADPDGIEVERYTNWQTGYTNPGSEVGFSGAVFQLTKPGQYIYYVQLLMNPSVPEVVDNTTDVNMCTVAGGYAGRVTSKWVNKGSQTIMPMPASVSVDNETFEVGAECTNDSSVLINAGIEVTVTDPDGIVRLQVPGNYAVDFAWMNPDTRITKPFNVSPVDKAGSWTVLFRFVMLDGTELARWEGTCLNAIGATGMITKVQFNKTPEGNLQTTGPTVEVTANGALFELVFFYKNISNFTLDNAGVEIVVRDPDGEVRASPAIAWADMPADNEIRQDYNCGPVDKAGAWTVHAEFKLLAGLVLHTMNFVCFTAVGLAGEIMYGFMSWGSVYRETLPRTVEAAGHAYEIGARYTNKGSYDISAGIKVELWDPAGSLRTMQTGIDWAGMGPNAVLDHEYNMSGILDIEGDWTGLITFLTEGGEVIDTFPKTGIGVMFTATPAVDPPDPTNWELAITNYSVIKGAV